MALSQVCDEVSCNMIIVEGFFPSFFFLFIMLVGNSWAAFVSVGRSFWVNYGYHYKVICLYIHPEPTVV